MAQDIFQGKIDVALSTFALGYRNEAYLAELLAPRVNVDNQSDKYFIFGRDGQVNDIGDDIRAPGSPAKQIKMTLSDSNYACPDHSLADVIPAEDVPKPNVPPRAQRATRTATDKLLLNHDIRTAALVSAAANYPTGHKVQLTGIDQWGSGDAAAVPQGDVDTGKLAVQKALGKDANVLVISPDTLLALRGNADVKASLRSKDGSITAEDIRLYFDVERLLVWRTIKRTAAGVNSFVMGKHAVLLHVEETQSMEDVSFAKTFVWAGAPGTVAGFQVLRGPISPPSARAEEISVHFYHDEKITSAESGYLIEDAVA